MTGVGSILQVSVDFPADTIGYNHSANLRAFGLVGAELDLATSMAVLGGHIFDGECGNFPDTQAGIDGQDEC